MNKEKREHIKEIMHKSKSNISLYWNEKLSHIKNENEKLYLIIFVGLNLKIREHVIQIKHYKRRWRWKKHI
jgi:hypothetical protein